jgi:CRP-like cAMP-binding protein
MSNRKSELVASLKGFGSFANLETSDLEALVEAGGEFHLPAGWPLVQEGIPADACYFILDGHALVFYQRQQVATLGPGDVVGEMALLEGGQRKATVTSSTRISGVRIDNEKLRQIMATHPRITAAFQAVYSSHNTGNE